MSSLFEGNSEGTHESLHSQPQSPMGFLETLQSVDVERQFFQSVRSLHNTIKSIKDNFDAVATTVSEFERAKFAVRFGLQRSQAKIWKKYRKVRVQSSHQLVTFSSSTEV